MFSFRIIDYYSKNYIKQLLNFFSYIVLRLHVSKLYLHKVYWDKKNI